MMEAFEIIVSADGELDRDVAIAQATQYLTYTEHTDTVGLGGVFDVNVYGDDSTDQDYGIGLCVEASLNGDDGLKRFMDEMAQLERVESVERVSFQRA